jgi:predicted RNase H-like HicB family nuclease
MSAAKYLVVYEKGQSSIGAYVPDLPGCVAVGETLAETKQLIRKAVKIHLAAMRRDRLPIPKPTTRSEYLELAG